MAAADSASPDPAAREKALASQLRRRAMASRANRPSESERDRDGRDMSRTPPSSSSEASPPPRQVSRAGKRTRSRSRSRSYSPDRRVARRRDDHRERDRSLRRSGRDLQDDDENGEPPLPAESDGGRRRSFSIRGTSRRLASTAPEDGADDDDDARSIRSGRSYGVRRADSRDPDDHHRRHRDDRDRTRRHRSTRQDSYDRESYYSAASPAPISRDRDYDRERMRPHERHRDRRHPTFDYYAPPPTYYRDPYGGGRRESRRRRSPSPPPARRTPTPEREDYELRSIFCSQLAARLTQRDLGEFFEEKLGEDTVKDVRIVSDRVTGRSKGIGYVELVSEEMVERAIRLSGSIIFGIPILVQKTEAARNRGEGASTAQAPIRPNLPGGIPPGGGSVGALAASRYAHSGSTSGASPSGGISSELPLPPHLAGVAGNAIHLANLGAAKAPNPLARLYVGNLHFSLSEGDIEAIFGPFGAIEEVDLHREQTGKSKGFAFVQYKDEGDAERAIQNMNGFQLAGRSIRVAHSKSTEAAAAVAAAGGGGSNGEGSNLGGDSATLTSAFDEGGGGGLTAASRANLMQMLARGEGSTGDKSSAPAAPVRPSTIPQATSRAVLLKNMFNPEEETEVDWDTDLAEDVKGECSSKYGAVELCQVDKDSHLGEIYLRFTDLSGAASAIGGLNGRFFGGRKVSAEYISESFLNAKLG